MKWKMIVIANCQRESSTVVTARAFKRAPHRVRGACGLLTGLEREFQTLALLQKQGIPAPLPVFLDDKGDVLGIPGIVTTFIEGAQVMAPQDSVQWVNEMTSMLARIHSIRCTYKTHDFLLDADAEAVWFLNSGKVPEFMLSHPRGEIVWKQVRDLVPQKMQVQDSLVHIDYSPGNILWSGDRISAVLDWEEAACGDPAIDVAYMYIHMFLTAPSPDLAGKFVEAYQAATGKQAKNLKLWELAAAVRFMPDPANIVPELKSLGNIQCTPDSVRTRLSELIEELIHV